MALVEYSDSESSDIESHVKPKSQSEDSSNSRKSTFRKVVDRSNPHRILVNLPEKSESLEEAAEPVNKKVKLGSSTFSSFNSLLPAPKKSSATGHRNNGGHIKRSGLETGVGLKTGPTPGFSRGETPVQETTGSAEAMAVEATYPEMNLLPSAGDVPSDIPKPQPALKGNPMAFKPLSVTRKSKKKSPNSIHEENLVKQSNSLSAGKSEPAPKISLFSTADIEAHVEINQSFNGNYQSLIYEPSRPSTTSQDSDIPGSESNREEDTVTNTGQFERQPNLSSDIPQTLGSIAEDLNLSASAKRQLLGRVRNDPSKLNLVSFNTDQEYAANELLRQAGEQIQHNPVRAIAPGKHSLKQLVNAASSQKDALEEHFATGKRNKKEAGSKYGW